MRNLRNQDDYWKPCRPGTILDVSDSKYRRDRRKFVVRATMGGVVLLTGSISALFAFLYRKKPKGSAVAGSNSFDKGDSQKQTETNQHVVESDNRDNQLAELTCRDISELVGSYVVAMRIDEQKRTEDQTQMIAGFEQHLQMCDKCPQMVENALNV